jgi:hypothetical protein
LTFLYPSYLDPLLPSCRGELSIRGSFSRCAVATSPPQAGIRPGAGIALYINLFPPFWITLWRFFLELFSFAEPLLCNAVPIGDAHLLDAHGTGAGDQVFLVALRDIQQESRMFVTILIFVDCCFEHRSWHTVQCFQFGFKTFFALLLITSTKI